MRRGIDHLVLGVRDLDQATRFYRQLGFTTTPRAEHPWGTDNRLVQLQGNFLELLTVARPGDIVPADAPRFSFGACAQAFLERRQGMCMLVLESSDAEADRVEFDVRGIGGYDAFHFERQATLPGGDSARVAFSLAFATSPGMQDMVFFTCQQHTPELFWKPEYQSHPNGAQMVSEVLIATARPDQHREFFSRLQEPGSVAGDARALTVTTPRGIITVLGPDATAHRFPALGPRDPDRRPGLLGFAIRVARLGSVRARLDEAGIAYETGVDRLWLRPEQAFGCVVEFHP